MAILGSIILFGYFLDFADNEPPPVILSIILIFAELLLLLPPWYFILRRGGSWGTLGLHGFRLGYLAVGCSLLLLSFFFNIVWALFLTLLDLQVQPDILPLFGEGGAGYFIALLVAGIVGPFAEEIYFRGFLFAGLRGHWGMVPALLASSALFAFFHILPTSILPIFVLGILLALLYHLSASLWPSIFMHAATNILALTAAYLLR